MKHSHGDETTSQNCPCTSCMYTGESFRPTVDDIRTQKLSESNLSISEKADLKPRKNLPLARRGTELDDDDAEKITAIQELVNLEGEYFNCPRHGSKISLREQEGRVHCPSIIVVHRVKDERRTGKHMPYKAKQIRSDPCTCMSKLSGNRESKALMKKFHSILKPTFKPLFETVDENRIRSRRKHKGYKVKQAGMGESMINSVKKSLQTMKLPQLPTLLPYECEPMVCIPGEHHPIDCEKIITQREKRYSTMNYPKKSNLKSRSTPSLLSYSVSSSSSESLEAYMPGKRENARPIGHDLIDKANPSKQTVRISTNLSLNIEFDKDGRANNLYKTKIPDTWHTLKIENTSKRDNAINKMIGHEPSPSFRSKKSKYTLIKNYVRRCFCNIRSAKPEPKIKKIQSYSIIGTLTTVKQKPKSSDIATEKREGKSYVKNALLPGGLTYEGEPKKCIPGECNPYKCLEETNRRKLTKTCTRRYGTDKYKTKSFIISRKRNMHVKTVNMHSILSSQKRDAKVKHVKKKPVMTVKAPIATINVIKPKHQDIRIGSSISLNVEFCKDKLIYSEVVHMPTDLSFKTQARKRNKSLNVEKDRNLKQKYVHDSKTIQDFQVEVPGHDDKSTKTGSFINRCFCTAQLNKHKEWHQKEKGKTMKASLTFLKNSLYAFQCVVTGVKPKLMKAEISACDLKQKPKHRGRDKKKKKNYCACDRKQKKTLYPCPCKRKVSVPRECDPLTYEKRIRKINSYLDTTSSTEGQSISTKRCKTANQSVIRMNPNFSFSVELWKEKSPTFIDVQKTAKPLKDKTKSQPLTRHVPTNIRHKKTRGDKINCIEDSQVWPTQFKSTTAEVSPYLKRCLCTLRLQESGIMQKRYANIIKQVTKNNDAPKMRERECPNIMQKTTQLTNTEAPKEKFTTSKLEPEYYNAKTTARIKNRQYNLEADKCEDGVCVIGEYDEHECEKNLHKKTKGDKATVTEDPKRVKSTMTEVVPFLKRCFCTLKLKESSKVDSKQTAFKPREQYPNAMQKTTQFTHTEPTKEKKVSTNISIPEYSSAKTKPRIKNRLTHKREAGDNSYKPVICPDPYECEPGVCDPDKCDQCECEKLIKRRQQCDLVDFQLLTRHKKQRTKKQGVKLSSTEESQLWSNTGKPKKAEALLKGLCPMKLEEKELEKTCRFECPKKVPKLTKCGPKMMMMQLTNTEAPKERRASTMTSKPEYNSATTTTRPNQRQRVMKQYFRSSKQMVGKLDPTMAKYTIFF